MKAKKMIFQPTIKQLRKDKKKELVLSILVGLFIGIIFFVIKQYHLMIIGVLPFCAYFHHFIRFKNTINKRKIQINESSISVDAPKLHDALKEIALKDYDHAELKGNILFMHLPKQKISIKMQIKLGGDPDLTGYPDKNKIVEIVNEKIKNIHNKIASE
jgi:hypothetical protein